MKSPTTYVFTSAIAPSLDIIKSQPLEKFLKRILRNVSGETETFRQPKPPKLGEISFANDQKIETSETCRNLRNLLNLRNPRTL